MDLTHLDDVQPPTPDAAMRSRVVKTARSRRHVRVALESGTALVVAVAIIIAGVASTRGSSHQVRVAITAPPTSTTVARGDVTVRIELDHDTVAPGGTIHGTLVFTNPTGRIVTVSGNDYATAIKLLEERLNSMNHQMQLADTALPACGRDRNCVIRTRATIRVLNASVEDLRKQLNKAGDSCVHQYQVVIDTREPTDLAWSAVCEAFIRQSPDAASAHDSLERRFLAVPTGVTRVRFSMLATPPSDSLRVTPLARGRAYVYFVVEGGAEAGLVTPAPVPITIK